MTQQSALIAFAVVALLGAALAILWSRRTRRATAKQDSREAVLGKRILDMEAQLSLIGQSVLPISTAFQAVLIKELVHYHTPVMDALLAKVSPLYILTDTEYDELIVLLEQRTKDMGDLITDSERDGARILPIIMKRARAETQAMAASAVPAKLRMVMIPTDGGDD